MPGRCCCRCVQHVPVCSVYALGKGWSSRDEALAWDLTSACQIH